MTTKKCSTCKETKCISEFYPKTTSKDGLDFQCRNCAKKYRCSSQRKMTVARYHKKRIKLHQRIMHDLKINGCAICGYNKCQDALVFHHANNEDKCFLLHQSCLSHGDEKIVDEFNKCILLCANCHRELHYKERKKNKWRKIKMKIINLIEGDDLLLN